MAQAKYSQELERYLLGGEHVVTAVHQHWAKVAEPVGSAVAGGLFALWVDASVPNSAGLFSTIVWWAWFVLVVRMAYRLAEWRHDWFVATDKRLLLFYGFITRKVSMMPLMKVTDMSYERSIPGRILGYGRFVLESAGQDQALREINWVPQPDYNYRAICAEIFGVSSDKVVHSFDDQPRSSGGWPWSRRKVPQMPVPSGGADQAGRETVAYPSAQSYQASAGGRPAEYPDPYPGWDQPARLGDRSASLYRSPDLTARDRSADTGPIPISRPPQRPALGRPDAEDDQRDPGDD